MANVNKVMLELGIKVSGMMDVSFVTEGTTESNLEVMLECLFLEKKDGDESKSG